jgi:hypothetical protein
LFLDTCPSPGQVRVQPARLFQVLKTPVAIAKGSPWVKIKA